MQKGGGDADDGLNPPPFTQGGGATGSPNVLPTSIPGSTHSAGSGSGPVSAVSTDVLSGALQTSDTAPNVVCPQTGLPPQLRELISNSPTTYRPINPHSLTPATSLPAHFLSGSAHSLGRRVYTPTTAAVASTSPNMLSSTLPPAILTSHPFHRQLFEAGSRTLTTDPVSLPSNTSISASGGTIHHHGQSPTRGGLPPFASPSQALAVSNAGAPTQRVSREITVTSTTVTTTQSATSSLSRNLFDGLTKSLTASTLGPSPRKKPRIEEVPAASPEIAQQRKLILDSKYKDMGRIKNTYIEHLTELFFLQNGGNIMDYLAWKKRPTPQLVHFLKSGNLDSDEEEDHQFQVKTYNDEVKVLTGAGSDIPLSTPVAISKTLPPNVSALTQGSGSSTLGQTLDKPKQHISSTSDSTASTTPTVTVSISSPLTTTITTPSSSSGQPSTSTASKPVTSPLSPPANLHSQLAKCIGSLNASQIKSALNTPTGNGSPKSRFSFTKSQKQPLSSVCASPLGTQEAIVERAKQEAQVMQRVAELRKEGMWSSRRLPKVQEPPRNKAHWDYLLEEMQWLAADFAQERKWKKAGARKIARMVAKYHQELHQKEIRAEKEEAMKLKRIAGALAKQIKEFWASIEKVVQYKQQSRLEEKRKKALDLHLNFIVDQTEKYSTWLTEGLTGSTAGSVCSDVPLEQAINSGDEDFQPLHEESDDEETIDKEELEAGSDEASTLEEIAALQKESEVPIEELIRTIPKEVFSKPASLADEDEDVDIEGDGASTLEEIAALQKESEVPIEELIRTIPKEVFSKPASLADEDEDVDIEGDGDSVSGGNDDEFQGEEEVDLEETIDEQEKHERKSDKQKEMQDLQAEGEMTLEELAEKYAGAYDSDFEFPNESTDDETESEEDSMEESEVEETEEEDEPEDSKEATQEDVGLEYLMHPETQNTDSSQSVPIKTEAEGEGPGKEITDIAAEALSLQPKGYTLQTTEVKTKVPFLLKHKLREYQHVGLNWLATMYEKRLNGILADEMGLGKTIQTIALLAHLACEKGVWGPHLIVVPTSVMLNWEMEIKKWCPAFKILTYYGNQKERKQKRQGWTKTNAFHICITSYKLVIQDHQSFRRKKWKYFILDEAQNIKNFKSQRWQTLLNFSSQRRLLLTGTPLQNSLMELWSLMHFLMPHVFQSHKEFKEWFSNPLSGMIEGSHEYNDSLIRRLHKVLRPFLLRRLKDDVEKQMPKKYEHVIMCKLSKRQRYLYDDFMAQTKTKETLSSGHFMSVINILMQLRKVCNHPNLFDPRPIISPFQMEGIVYHTPSLVLQALQYDPFKMVDLRALYPTLADMEYDLPLFVAERVRKRHCGRKLITEIDSLPDPPPRPKPAKKPIVFRSVSPVVQQPGSGRSSPAISPSVIPQGRSASPITIVRTAPNILRTQSPVPAKLGVATPTQIQVQKSTSAPVATAVVQPVSHNTMVLSSQQVGTRIPAAQITGLQATKLSTIPGSAIFTSAGGSPILPSQPITVQIQQTDQGTQLMIPSTQLSQLPAGFIQIVQTSTGQQLITTASPATSVQQGVSASQLLQGLQSVRPSTPTTSLSVSSAQIVQRTPVTSAPLSIVPQASIVAQSPTPVGATPSSTPTIRLGTSTPQLATVISTIQPTVQSASPLSTQTLVNGVTAVSGRPTTMTTALTNSTPTLRTTPVSLTPSRQPNVMHVTSTVTGLTTASKPVMRVSPLTLDSSRPPSSPAILTAASSKPSTITTSSSPVLKTVSKPVPKPVKPKSEFHWNELECRRRKSRQEKLELLCKLNKRHCDVKPLFGKDLCSCVNLLHRDKLCKSSDSQWKGGGYVHCYNVQHCKEPRTTEDYFSHTDCLSNIVHTPDQYLTELSDILQRYVFVTPVAIAPPITIQTAHPPPSYLFEEKRRKVELHQEISPRLDSLHTVTTNMTVTFPELRLIQYDCGKLQTMDILLRDLKAGDHRVLIFTQMTKMLNVLECFLNYHGHRYLRLDGTTKVEQRQALMERFNGDRRIFCFILSTRSGGLGINLTGADTVIFYDSDWNPTMDAQAQDRCHRIGQTRDVHIYRLISQKTIEENILKKANQKRLLGDLAIEGGNFTTAFFKEQTLKDLFEEPSGLDQLAKEKAATQERKEARAAAIAAVELPGSESENKTIVAKFEEALCKAEDETDVLAANQVRAEQKAELAEFDENIPWDEKDEKKKDEDDVSKVEQELAMLEKELSPVERYAVFYIESQMEPYNAEELEIAEEEVELAKNSWELNRLKSLKEEEERRAEWEEDEMLFTYSRENSHNQVKKSSRSRRSQGGSRTTSTSSTPQPRPSRSKARRSTDSAKETPISKAPPVKLETPPVSESQPIIVPNHMPPTPKIKSPIANHTNSPKPCVKNPNGQIHSPKPCPPSSSNTKTASPTINRPKVMSPKDNVNQNIPLPWSNPNLVIRTRRAIKQEAVVKKEERLRKDSENSEVDILSVQPETNPIGNHVPNLNSNCVYQNAGKPLPGVTVVEKCKLVEVITPMVTPDSANGLNHVNEET